MEEEHDYAEDQGLLELSPEELAKFNRTVEEFIRNQSDKQNTAFLVDNLIRLEDNLGNIKSSYYDKFDQQLLASKNLLQSALLVAEDKTIKSLIADSISKIDECLERLGIKEEPQKYQEPKYEPKKSSYYPEKYGHRYFSKEPDCPEEESAQDLSRALMYQNKEPIPSRFKLDLMAKEPDPLSDRFWSSVIQRLQDTKNEYFEKLNELNRLKQEQAEALSEEKTLSRFRSKLLDKCIRQMFEDARR
jgi:hypothetical protein